MRITRKQLDAQVAELNTVLGLPTKMFASKEGEFPTRYNIGHITLDKNSAGYQLEEQTSINGGTFNMTARLAAKDMSLFIHGMMRGIWLQRDSGIK